MMRNALASLLRMEPDIDVVAELGKGDEAVTAAEDRFQGSARKTLVAFADGDKDTFEQAPMHGTASLSR